MLNGETDQMGNRRWGGEDISYFFSLLPSHRWSWGIVFYTACLEMLVLLSDQLCLFVAWEAVAGVVMYHFTFTSHLLHLSRKHQHISLVIGLISRVPGLRHRPLRAFGRLLTIQNNCGKVEICFEKGYTTWSKPGEGLRIAFPSYCSTQKRLAPSTRD